MVLVAALAAVAAIAPGCRQRVPENVDAWPWTAGELSLLRATGDETGDVLADWEMEVDSESEEQIWVLTTRRAAGTASVTTTARVRASDLRPVSVESQAWEGEAVRGFAATYGAESVTVTFQEQGATRESTIPLPEPPFYDNEELVFVLRTLPFEVGWTGVLRDIVTQQGQTAEVEVKVTGQERVTVAAGDYDCWVVEMPLFEQTAWIAADSRHEIVQYLNRRSGRLFKLVSFRPGG